MTVIRCVAAALIIASLSFAVGCSDGRDADEPDKTAPAETPGATAPTAASRPETDAPSTAPMEAAKPMVIIETSLGDITVELWPEKAPITVENFLTYVDEGFYDGTVFHRVIGDFMIQGGGMTRRLQPKATRGPIRNEASADLKNRRGTIAMARTGEIHSATSQFFINTVDNPFLDHRDETPRGFGYAVFGRVVAGMEVVDSIGAVETRTLGGMADVPAEPVVIERIRRAN